jgi:hypothetical protein
VVCDYNYYFDMGGLLYGLTLLNECVTCWWTSPQLSVARGMYRRTQSAAVLKPYGASHRSVMKAPLEWQHETHKRHR